MGLLRRIADRFDPKTEQRARIEPSWAALAGGAADWTALKGGAQPALTPRLAENAATVAACVSAIAQGIASLPAFVYRLTPEGREIDDAHPVARLIRRGANEHQSWPDFAEWLVASALLHGNALAEIVADRSGRVVELRPIPWPSVTVRLLAGGRLVYDVSDINALYGGTGRVRRLLDGEVIHLRDRTDDGLVGRSRLSRCAGAIRLGLTMGAFSETLYDNRATPSGVVSTELTLTPEQGAAVRDAIREGWRGVRNAGEVLMLTHGLKFSPITISPEDAELLAARRFSTEEIARLFQVPPPIVGIWDHSSFTNSETAGRWFAQFTLAPWIRKIEDAFRRAVFSGASAGDHVLEIDLSGFLRGDAEARWKAHEIAVRNRILTPNEIREVEGWNPRPGADDPAPPAGPEGQP
jgi:HK97 family phage portal protein